MGGGFGDATAASLYWELRTDPRGTRSFISAVDDAVLAESPIRVFKLKDVGEVVQSIRSQLGNLSISVNIAPTTPHRVVQRNSIAPDKNRCKMDLEKSPRGRQVFDCLESIWFPYTRKELVLGHDRQREF